MRQRATDEHYFANPLADDVLELLAVVERVSALPDTFSYYVDPDTDRRTYVLCSDLLAALEATP